MSKYGTVQIVIVLGKKKNFHAILDFGLLANVQYNCNSYKTAVKAISID